jgi:hypothetical protein
VEGHRSVVVPPPSVIVEQPTPPAPTETVRTKNGAVYHGELVESVPTDHVTLKLATGAIKRIDQADIVDGLDEPPPAAEVREAAPVENVYTKNGSI